MTKVHIELISDFICPWCYIGKARLERVRAAIADDIELDIEVKPYILYPHIPPGGLPKSDFAKKTKPGMGRSLKYEAGIENIQINYRHIERIPYSFEAHRLVSLVKDSAKKYELAKQIFYDYFEKGQDIEDPDYLQTVGKKVGMTKAVLSEFLFTDIGAETVRAAIQATKEEFIRVVPSIRLDGKIVLPGLQTAEVWERYIRRAAQLQQQSGL